jgi:hypothetical protein
MKIGDVSHNGKMILNINEKHMTIVPITSTVNRKTNPKSYSEFTFNGRKKYALLWLMEQTDPNINFTPFINVDKEIVDKILEEYLQNYYSVANK